MNKKNNGTIIKTLFKKEMLDVLRDKKTVIMMLVVPIILYPLIFIVALQVMSTISSGMEAHTYNVVVDCQDDGRLADYLQQYENTGNTTDSTADSTYSLHIMDTSEISDYESALQKESIDVYVTSITENSTITYQVYYLSSATNSEYAADIIYQSVLQVKQEMRKERVEEAGLDVDYILEPVAYAETDIASKEQSMGSLLGSILPFMLVISLLMGTMYPAIDTTAGERERGTLETILTLPVTNRQLIVSKFLTVALIGIVSALLNIISMGGIAWYMFKVMNIYGNAGSIRVSSFIPAILVCILAILAFSLLISAITMCVTAFAKSYKEANNYITPLMLVVLFTAYIGFIPNVELTRGMAMVPVANICLLVKNLMLFKFDYTIVALVLISNIAYAAFAILFLSKIYDSESILFGEGKTGVQLFEKRSNMKKGGVPTTGDAWFVCMLVIVLVIYFGGLLELKYGIYGVFGTQMMILFVPLLMALYTKKDIKETYSLRKTGLLSFLGGIFLVLGTLLIGVLLSGVMSALFPDSASAVSDSFEDIMNHGIGVSLLVIAFTPAICEELMFRGYIYAAMRNRYKAVTAILIVAAVFGLYHMSIVKFLTTGLLGGMLCYTVYCTGSIFPAMVMHCLNNAISVLVYYYPEAAGRICPILMKESLTGMDILLVFAAGAVLMTVGILILRRNRRKLEERLCE